MDEEKNVSRALIELKKEGNFDISPCDNIVNIEDNPKFKKLELTSGQKMQMSALASQLPSIMALEGMAALSSMPNLYTLSFPEGLPHTLMKLKQGGFSTTILDSSGIRGSASLNPVDISKQLSTNAMVLGTFSVMSVVSGQYFLAQINSELSRIKLGMDKILGFLYGDKKAELMSEVNFVKYAYQNYSSIMSNENQRIATIASLQQARKIAMKDSEFYINDLEATVKGNSDIIAIVDDAVKIKKSLELALQLCVMSMVMEVHYSQNFDEAYLEYIDNDISLYIDKCQKSMLSSFSRLHENIQSLKSNPLKKIDKAELDKRIGDVVNTLNIGGESDLTKSFRSGLYLSDKQSSYYLSKDGIVYIKTA